MADHTQARLQRIEDHLRNLDEQVAVLSAVDDGPARQHIQETFGNDARMVIIYRGVQRQMKQREIAAALKSRGLPRPNQSDVSLALSDLDQKKFVRKVPGGGFILRPGWDDYGLEKTLRKTLKAKKIDDLA